VPISLPGSSGASFKGVPATTNLRSREDKDEKANRGFRGPACARGHAGCGTREAKIGFVGTFSGPAAVIGNDMRDGFELALDHLGRKVGSLAAQVIYEDDQQKPEVGKQKTDKLISSDRVNFLTGYIWSNVLLASLKPAVDAQTFLISANAGPSQIAGELCSPWFFSVSWQGDQVPQAIGEYLNQKAVNELALGIPGAQHWVSDLPNEANKKFVADFRAKYGRYPSFYAAQAYDSAKLIDSAVAGVKGDLGNKDAIRDEMRKANYASVRGPYRYGNNHFPIQNFYLQETVKNADGAYTLKTVATALKDHQDRYHAKCLMK
jgi:ABC-type branched-subunit amino acid transport system substrate-binding protein